MSDRRRAFIGPVAVLAVMLLALHVGALTLPGEAHASSASGDVYKPTSVSPKSFKLKFAWLTGREDDPVTVATYTLRGSKKYTRFTVDYYNNITGHHFKRVSFKVFRSYVHSYGSSGSVVFAWKRDSHGKRYRYLKSVSVTNYAG
jgi:hypothetical protein